MKATRDVLEHNAGVANAVYVAKAGPRARYKPGERVEVSDAYSRDAWKLIKKIVQDVSAAVVVRLSKPAPPEAPAG